MKLLSTLLALLSLSAAAMAQTDEAPEASTGPKTRDISAPEEFLSFFKSSAAKP